MQTKKTLECNSEITKEEVKEALDTTISLLYQNLPDFTNQFPGANSEGLFYHPKANDDWTEGFFTGELWLAYEMTEDEAFAKVGEIHVQSFLQRIIDRVVVDHHDMGFLYTPSCVAAYQLTGNETAKKAALLAADNLLGRFQEKGQFFQAWGTLGAVDNYRLIIDCLLNMPLLFWASKVTGDEKYRVKAEAHIKTAMQYVIRPDNSTYHTYFFDPETGLPVKGVTHQGNRDGSAWARGQAWGIYGAALSYKRLRDPEYIEIFRKVTNYFMEHLPSDLIPYWDFDFDDGSTEPRDSSAAAIAACGMLEMSQYLNETEASYYRSLAKKLVKAMVEHYAVKDSKQSNGLLLHGTYARASENNPCQNVGVDECNTWGDYYYMESLVRLSKDWKSYW